jgi:hypothetical protein
MYHKKENDDNIKEKWFIRKTLINDFMHLCIKQINLYLIIRLFNFIIQYLLSTIFWGWGWIGDVEIYDLGW